jgi:hypothetical protein
MGRGKNWKRLLFIIVIVVNVGLYGAIYVLSQQWDSARDAPRVMAAEQTLTLGAAYRQALALALGWQPDVQLSGATTTWSLANGDRLTLSRSTWSFSFYSPAARQIQVVTVDKAGAQAGRRRSVSAVPQPVNSDWNLDSDDLLLTFLSYGGQAFLGDHPGANVHVWLEAAEDGRSVWYMTAVDPVSRQSLFIGMDARSRQIVLGENSTDPVVNTGRGG